MEFNEVASMGMELLADPYLHVFYGDEDKQRSCSSHLEDIVFTLVWVAMIDAFQHWIYKNPSHDAAGRHQQWLVIHKRFSGGVVNWDGLKEEHDASVDRDGIFDTAVQAIKTVKARGFRVTTNSTFFEGHKPERARAMFDMLMEIGVDGMMISPGYAYERAPDQDHFLKREETRAFFRSILEAPHSSWKFNHSALFLDFLKGEIEYDCTPWGNPTYSVLGWQRPCYLLDEGHVDTFAELMEETVWENYGHASGNPSCQQCMVHSGFEASAVIDASTNPARGLRTLKTALLG